MNNLLLYGATFEITNKFAVSYKILILYETAIITLIFETANLIDQNV
jgi:hypothetical protein